MAQKNRIIIHIGQSNATGRVDMVNLPVERQGLKYNLRVFNGTGFECIDSTINNNQYGEPTNQYGYEFEFLDFADRVGNDIYLLKYAVGGTCLATDAVQDWNVNTTGELYDNLLTHITTAINWMTSRGKSYEISVVIWHQGERDSRFQAMANAYETNESDFINGVNTHLGFTLPWYIIQLNEDLGTTYKSEVISAKEANEITYSFVNLINQDSCDATLDNNTHLTASGNICLGAKINSELIKDGI